MAGSERRWGRVKALTAQERAVVAAECERFIAEILKPRFLPEVRQTPFNYPIYIFGKWRGSKYSFIIRYRSGFPENAGEEFDAPFTRLDHLEECWAETRFDVLWRRHTGQWWRSQASVTLEEAFRLIETEPFLQPHV
jgi:hypothetical protein